MVCSSCSSSSVHTCGCQTCCPTTPCAEICTALVVANSWNVPACSASAILSIPGLTTVLIGSYIYNPTYGQFLITAFDSVNSQLTVTNTCLPENAAPGTVVPALTSFVFSAAPVLVQEDGWIAAGESWAYASATTITVPSDAALKYQKGMKIGLIQSATQKYFSIVDVSTTLLTITGGTDYTLTNNTISAPKYSSADSPLGFPAYFNYDGAPTGFSVVPVGVIYTFRVFGGGLCSVSCHMPNNGTSNATSFTIAAPVTARTVTNGEWAIPWSSAVDNGSAVSAAGRVAILTAGTTIAIDKTMVAASVWTNANGKKADFTNLVYPI